MAQSISQEAIGATGIPGATAASRHAGATASGAPTTGTFAVGDFIVDQSGAMYVCIVAGTPGTWQLSGVSVNENIAGKNFVINGGMDIWQRGTSSTSAGYQTADRWYQNASGSTTFSQETSNVPTGFKYAFKMLASATAQMYFQQAIETQNTLPMVSQTVTLSAFVKASTNTVITANLLTSTAVDNSASGSWASGASLVSSTNTITATSSGYTRLTSTWTIPSGTNSLLPQIITASVASGVSVYVTGVQLEIAPQATPFSRAGGSIGGELALCYRYYYRTTAYNQTTGSTYVYSQLSTANVASSAGQIYLQPMVPVIMRINPTSLDYNLSNIGAFAGGVSRTAITSISIASGNQFFPGVVLNSSTNSFTQGQTYVLQDQGSGNGYLGISAEL
jgi:hypothetical protein